MNPRRFWFALALFLLAPALASLAADNDNYGDPLPDGAKARIGTARLRTQAYSTPVLAPDGKSFYTPSAAGLIRIYPATGAKLGKAPIQFYGNLSAFSADGKLAVHTQYDKLIVWDTGTGKTVTKIERRLPGGDAPVALSADGKLLAVGGVGDRDKKMPVTILVWNTTEDKEVKSITAPQSDYSYVALSSDGKTLANWGSHYDPNAKPNDPDNGPGRFVYFWDATTGKELSKVRVPGYMASAVAFSPDGTIVAIGGNNTIELVDPKTGAPKQQLLGRTRMGRFITFSPDGTVVAATAEDGAVQRWRVSDGARLSTTEAPTTNVINARVRLADNDQGLAWGTRGIATVVWEVPSGKFIGPEGGHTNPIRGIAVTTDNKYVVTSADDGTTLRWELATGKPAGEVLIRRANTGFTSYAPGATFSTDATKALIPDSSGGIGLHDATNGVQQYVFPVPQDGISHGSFSADGSKVVIAQASNYDYKKKPARATVWDSLTSKKLGSVELPGYSQLGAAVTPDGKHLVTAGIKPAEKGASAFVLTGWDLATGAKKGELSEDAAYSLMHVVASSDNKTAAVVTSQGKLVAFDLLTGKYGKVYDTKGRSANLAPVFSPDGKRLAVACQTNFGENPTSNVLVIDWATGDVKHTFASPGQTPQAMAFSPDGKWLVTGSPDTTATIWDVSK